MSFVGALVGLLVWRLLPTSSDVLLAALMLTLGALFEMTFTIRVPERPAKDLRRARLDGDA